MTGSSYRNTFGATASATSYDTNVYASGSSAELLWRVEAAILRAEVEAASRGRPHPEYLDFACGTGRITALLEKMGDTTAIDVSPYMLERARQKCSRAKFLCTDITAPGVAPEGKYDVITSFRFLTNAEDELRRAVLAGLFDRLKDDGVLIVNTHGNPFSYRLLLLPYHWAKDRIRSRPLFGYLSNRMTRSLLDAAGFRVQKIIGMGFVPEKLLWLLPTRLAAAVERALAGRKYIQATALNQMFICTKKT